MLDALVAGAIIGLACVTLFKCMFEEGTPDTARGEFLDMLAYDFCIDREYYGNSKDKPNDHCHYRGLARTPGWYENDDTLRDRIAEDLHNV